MRYRIGELAPLAIRPTARVTTTTTAAPVVLDYCPLAAAARARNSPAAAGLEAKCAAQRAAATAGAADTMIVASAPAVTAVGPCGAEPTRNPHNQRLFLDVDAGNKWLACMAAIERAKEKAYYDSVVAGAAGGEGGCGPDASTIYNSGSEYTGAALKAAWAACRARTLPPQPAIVAAPSAPSSSSSGGGSTYYGGGGGGGGGDDAPSSPSAPSGGGDLVKTPVSASIDVPPELWIGLGILGAATILGGIYIATRRKAA